jgi:hypothetical protein
MHEPGRFLDDIRLDITPTYHTKDDVETRATIHVLTLKIQPNKDDI